MRIKITLLIAAAFFVLTTASAQKRTTIPSNPNIRKPQKNEQNSNSISLFKLYNKASEINVSKDIKDAVFLELDFAKLAFINKQKPTALVLDLPLSPSSKAQFYLKSSKVVSDDFTLITANNEKVPYTPGLYYQGTVAGNNPSLAAWSLFDRSVMTVFSWNNENYNLGVWKDESNANGAIYILFKESNVLFEHSFECHSESIEDKTRNLSKSIAKSIITNPQTLFTNCVKVYFECDYQMYLDNGNSTTNVGNFVTGFFNSVQTMYANENIGIEISQIYTWTTSDPYIPNTTSTDLLNNFQATRTSFNGDLAHLLTTRNLGAGGLAYLDVLCTPSYAYGISNIDNNYISYPTFSWTTEVVTHELGHNVGSHHTHWCGWTGGALDDCYAVEGNCSPGPHPSNGGTIMSYCHLSNTGILLTNGFGTQPGNAIRTAYAAASCLTACTPSDPVCANTVSISACGVSNSQTFAGGGSGTWNTNTASACGSVAPGTEKVYSFTPSSTGTYSLQVTAASGNMHYEWKASSCGSTGWTCIGTISNPGQYGTMAWTAGTTYYILLDDADATVGTHTFYVNCLPGNTNTDPCANVINITGCGSANSKTFVGDTVGSWHTNTATPCGYWAQGLEQVYTFTPSTTGTYSIHIAAATGYVDYLWKTGTCDSTGWTCIEDTNAIGQYGAMSWTAGTTYYILLDDEAVNGIASTHTFYLTCPGGGNTGTDPCSNIVNISNCGSSGVQNFVGDTVGSWHTNTSTPCGYWAPGSEQIYSFTPSTTGNYSVQITSATGYVDYMWKTGTCDSTGWTCIQDTNLAGQYGSMSWTAGTTYYILLDDEAVGGTGSMHSFYINCAGSGGPDACSSVVAISNCGPNGAQTYTGGGVGLWNNTSNDACGHNAPGIEKVYSFTPSTTGIYSLQVTAANGYVDYEWKANSCSSTGWTCIGNINAVGQYGNLSLTSGTTYYFLLDDENSITGTHTFYIKCINDNPCANAVTISNCGSTNSQSYSGGGSGQWNSIATNACSATSPGIENIFSFTPSSSGVYSIQVTAANGKVDYQWMANTCSPTGWNCIGAINLPGQYGAMNWTSGTTYYILLDDENAATGVHNFYITCPNITSGIAEKSMETALHIVPNPSNGSFTVSIDNFSLDRVQITVFDVLGQIVYTTKSETISGNYSKDVILENAAKGMYTVRVYGGNKVVHKKIIVE
jgi:hypothetical protein